MCIRIPLIYFNVIDINAEEIQYFSESLSYFIAGSMKMEIIRITTPSKKSSTSGGDGDTSSCHHILHRL